MKNKTLAAIDIGTNTFRLLIAEVSFDPLQENYSIKEIHSERVITRLGEGLSANGHMLKEPMIRSINALRDFSAAISIHKVSHISAVATSVLREASNSGYFLEHAIESSGLDIRVISGKEEAEITASGMLIDMPLPKTALMIDIGGGSTELIYAEKGTPEFVQSINAGVVYLAGTYMSSDPPVHEDLRKMEKAVMQKMSGSVEQFQKFTSKDTVFIGTAGTVTALAAIDQGLINFNHDKIHNYRLTRDNVKSIYSTISTISSGDRGRLIPFELARLDIIVPGTLILLKIMESFGFNEITVSNYGLREGILIDLYNKTLK